MNLDSPALAPPVGVVPDFNHPPNRNGLAVGIFAACATVGTICVCLRAYARVYLLRKIQVEEILVTIAYGFYWGALHSALSLRHTPGYFVHQWNIRLRDLIPTNYYIFTGSTCYTLVLPCLKCAILIEWIRLFAPRDYKTKSLFWWASTAIMIVQITSAIGFLVALNLQCIPHKAIYDFTLPGKCFEVYKLQMASGVIHLLTDIAMLLLPQHVIWRLKMTWRKRLGVSVTFGCGVLASMAAAFRLHTSVVHGKATDSIYQLAPLAIWSAVEMTCGFIVVCLPCIPRILSEVASAKKGLGTKVTSTGPSRDLETYGGVWTGSDNACCAPGSMHMTQFKGSESESTEQLHESSRAIVRTTEITVTKECPFTGGERSKTECVNSDEARKGVCPWQALKNMVRDARSK
ncbi:hypothetical protein BDV25DRAFT_137834 [Aspergillus avenaceus]|uniref:Rhodopsin domain-containing protein n=1 Tax=Aspergillus avenaceus TaxID=36643 RepID=A0A5N6U1N3_ASPAV|nr:hypothetical protein BDV25DRAFT_137834 [Aspergillus avenaceus]